MVTTGSASVASPRRQIIGLYGAVALLNVGGWAWAFFAFGARPTLLGMALLVYGLGLRHALDADHIAAIDNVTRKLMQEGRSPASAGFWFALGHSTLVVLATVAIVSAASMFSALQSFRVLGAAISTIVSTLFLLGIAAANSLLFVSIYQRYRRARRGADCPGEDVTFAGGGFLSRCFRPLYSLVSRSWHMLLLGFVFGLGFDTATEVAMFSVSGAEAAKGFPLAAIAAFPILFAAGMVLLDTTDGVLMMGAYRWALFRPMRKLYYNMMMTLLSALIALGIGSIQALVLVAGALGLHGAFWATLRDLPSHFNAIGIFIVLVFGAGWMISAWIHRTTASDFAEAARIAGDGQERRA